jgi:hypothetical protein
MILDLAKGYIKIATKPIIILPLSLIPKLNRKCYWIYNLSFLLASSVNNAILEKYGVLVYTIVTAI